MKNFYNISKAQLYVLWVFGMIATFWAIDKATYSHYSADFTIPELLSWFIPLALFFYTLGWRDYRKEK